MMYLVHGVLPRAACAALMHDARVCCVQEVDFSRAGNLMAGAMTQLSGLLAAASGSGHMCKLIMFIVAVFFLLWFLLSKR